MFLKELKNKLIFATVPLFLVGCQSMSFTESSGITSQPTVMELWNSYNQCQATESTQLAYAVATRLNHAAEEALTISPSPVPLPSMISEQVSEPLPRLSVDPRALSASCSLHAGEVALAEGNNRLAAEMFRMVLQYQFRERYGYYLLRAEEGLSKTSGKALISRRNIPGKQSPAPSILVRSY